MLGLSMGGGGYRRSKEDHMQLRKVSPGCLRSEFLSSSLSQTCGSLEFCKPVSLQLRPSGVGRQTFC